MSEYIYMYLKMPPSMIWLYWYFDIVYEQTSLKPDYWKH